MRCICNAWDLLGRVQEVEFGVNAWSGVRKCANAMHDLDWLLRLYSVCSLKSGNSIEGLRGVESMSNSESHEKKGIAKSPRLSSANLGHAYNLLDPLNTPHESPSNHSPVPSSCFGLTLDQRVYFSEIDPCSRIL